MIVHILLGKDRDPVAGGGTKAPIVQGFEHLSVNGWSQALNHNFLNDATVFVDGDLDDHITLQTLQFGSSHGWIGRNNRQGRA